MTRYGSVIGLNADKLDEYKRLHAAVWPERAEDDPQCNIRNYSIYSRRLRGPLLSLQLLRVHRRRFRRRHGEDGGRCHHAKMVGMLQALPGAACRSKPGEWWANMEEVFHTD